VTSVQCHESARKEAKAISGGFRAREIKEGIVDFPRHLLFLNLDCLWCGLYCKNYETPDVVGNLASKIEEDQRYDLLNLVDQYTEAGGGVSTNMDASCRALRKVRNKPYFYCRLNDYKNYLTTCRDYLCSKSIPVSNINYSSIDELINKIGLDRYIELIKTDWEEEFDWSKSANKTRIKKIAEKVKA
jgi:hypothetical protein